MSSTGPIKLSIPRQDLQEFTLFRLDADAASQWAQALPVANTKAVATQLRNVLEDLNRVQLGPELRFGILEVLRSNLQVTLANLSRRYLNQPLVLPVEPRQLAEMADTLCSAACTAYTVVATEALRQQDAIRDVNPARLVCASIQAALEFAAQRLLLTFQLYRTVELHGWLEMHQLYALAESQNLENLPVADGRSVSATYLQGLMLGCCKPNQLRQSDQAAIFRGLREWAKFVQILPPESETGLFIVDLDSDQPPLYSSLYDNRSSSRCRYVNTAPLVEHLEQLQAEDERQGMRGIAFDKDTTVPSNILHHLITSLGETSVRNFSRSSAGKSLCIGIGLSSTHFLLAGEKSFEQLLYGEDYVPPAAKRVETNPFLQDQDKRDLWQQANPEEDYAGDDEEADAGDGARDYRHRVEVDDITRAVLEDDDDAFIPPRKSYPVYRVNTIDASPGGYCVAWPEELPGDIRTGDIVSVREDQDKAWAIAVIRWISSLEDAGTMIGLELLSPRAKPYGAIIHQKKGVTSDPIRVLLLPEISLVGQPHTLITPRAGFRERQKITLLREGEGFYIQLLRQVAGTGSFTQFDFRYIKQLGEVVAEDKSGPLDSPFDSVWSKL
jgi:hypothetical protein